MSWGVGEKKTEGRKTSSSKTVPLRSSPADPAGEVAEATKGTSSAGRAGRDLAGGMEILELDFLLSVIEATQGAATNDVTMRKLSFNELIRRGQLDEIDSTGLKVYAKDADKLYGKDIQCEALKELTRRTGRK